MLTFESTYFRIRQPLPASRGEVLKLGAESGGAADGGDFVHGFLVNKCVISCGFS
jgi:hypothetical protein